MDTPFLCRPAFAIWLFLLASILLTLTTNSKAANALDASDIDAETIFTEPRPTTKPDNLVKPNPRGKLVLVIDDIGYNLPLGKRATELPGAITYAVIPHTPLAKKLAFYAINSDPNKEIIVHMPMQSLLDKPLGKGALTNDLGKTQFLETLNHALNEVPFAKGLSNHMGSQLTTLPDRMQWLMGELQRHNYFFLDSRTHVATSPQKAALKKNVPYLGRDIFLDHDPSPAAIAAAFEKATTLAKTKGYAVILAHPYPSTLTFLEGELPTLAKKGIQLSTVTGLLKSTKQHQRIAANY